MDYHKFRRQKFRHHNFRRRKLRRSITIIDYFNYGLEISFANKILTILENVPLSQIFFHIRRLDEFIECN